jgi:hypothetical protein
MLTIKMLDGDSVKVTRIVDSNSGMPTLELSCPKYWTKRNTINLIKGIAGVRIIKDRALPADIFDSVMFCEFELNGTRFRIENPDEGWEHIIHPIKGEALHIEIDKIESSILSYVATSAPDNLLLRILKLIYKFSLYGFIAVFSIAIIYLIVTGEPLSI